jgi:hypothetical protein
MSRGLSLHSHGRMLFGASLLAAAITAVLIVVPEAATNAGGNRLDAKVLVTNPGPLPACSDVSPCTDTNGVLQYIRIENGNALVNHAGRQSGATRADVPNSFVVSSIDEAIFVDGVQDHDFDFTYTPPPNPSFQPYSGHWVVSVTCPPGGPPCANVSNPAVLPGEETSVFWTGWSHGNTEPNGTYVFKFTIHGTLDANPVTLTASTPPIVMTS